jgi:hypothetical protein
MSNLDEDDSIKQFFNKVARNPNIDYDERDWQKMEKMLDAENAREAAVRSARWRGAAIGFGLLSLSLLIYFFVSNPETSQPSKETSAENSTQTGDLSKPVERHDPIKSTESNNNAVSIDPALPNDQMDKSTLSNALTDSKKSASPKSANRQNKQSERASLSKSVSTEESTGLLKVRVTEEEGVLPITSSVNNTDESANVNEVNLNNSAIAPTTNSQSRETAQMSTDSTEIKKDSAVVKSVNENEEEIKNNEKEKAPGHSRWSVSLAVAPDFSSTEIFKQASAGTAVGFTIQYELHKKWSLQTGALFTNKKYWNMGDEYTNIRPGYWVARTNGVIPERIDGGCHVLEIPLALRYTLLNVKSNRIQVSGGVSSYIMVYETYHFTFEDPNPTAVHDYESSKTQNYYLSMGSVSLSYERMIHPKLSIGIEPYMKIPFAEIGWAKLPLYTTGAYLTLRYRIAN